MSERARHALERFPDLAEAIKQYSADNRFFRSLCEDYGEAVDMLHQWEKAAGAEATEHVKACRELVTDLEQDILLELRRWNESGSGAADDEPAP